MRDAEEMDADRSTRADLKYRSTDWTDWAWESACPAGTLFGVTYINNPSQSSDGIRSIDDLQVRLHILHD